MNEEIMTTCSTKSLKNIIVEYAIMSQQCAFYQVYKRYCEVDQCSDYAFFFSMNDIDNIDNMNNNFIEEISKLIYEIITGKMHKRKEIKSFYVECCEEDDIITFFIEDDCYELVLTNNCMKLVNDVDKLQESFKKMCSSK